MYRAKATEQRVALLNDVIALRTKNRYNYAPTNSRSPFCWIVVEATLSKS